MPSIDALTAYNCPPNVNDLAACDLSLYGGILVKQYLNTFGMQTLMQLGIVIFVH